MPFDNNKDAPNFLENSTTCVHNHFRFIREFVDKQGRVIDYDPEADGKSRYAEGADIVDLRGVYAEQLSKLRSCMMFSKRVIESGKMGAVALAALRHGFEYDASLYNQARSIMHRRLDVTQSIKPVLTLDEGRLRNKGARSPGCCAIC